MRTRLLAIIISVTGVSLVIFNGFDSVTPSSFSLWILGVGMLFSGLLLLRYTPTVKELDEKKRRDGIVASLKSDGEKILIDFSTCEIKEHNYMEEQEKKGNDELLLTFDLSTGGKAWGLKSLARQVESVQVVQSVIIYGLGKEKFISPVIPKDKVTLSFLLEEQKSTYLYIDKNDRRRYYFDLEFLIEKS